MRPLPASTLLPRVGGELTPAEYATGWYRVDTARLRRRGKLILARARTAGVYLQGERCSIYDRRPGPRRDSRLHVAWPA